MVRRFLLFVVMATALVISPLAPASAAPPAQVGDVIPGAYIVTVRDGVAVGDVAAAYDRASDVRTERTYRRALRGFSVRTGRAGLERLRADARVADVEPDRVIGIAQSTSVWGLDRSDQRDRQLDGVFAPDGDGAGVTAYVVDTGIRAHQDLSGRIGMGATAVNDGRGTDDCNGHGTHVAGTVAGTVHGVAKAARVVPIRVLDCQGQGSYSAVIAGIDWVSRNAARPAVMNLSLGGPASSALDGAIRSAVAAGITVVVAAGNETANACDSSPARVGEALTVGATTSSDARASFSNFGSCLDLFAPGYGIVSAGISSPTSTRWLSGTSMAAPHVAGAAALALGAEPSASPAQVTAAIVDNATTGKVTSGGTGSPNRLLYAGGSAATVDPPPEPDPEPAPDPEPEPDPDPEPAPEPAPPAPVNNAPTARATVSCLREVCTFDSGGSSDADGTIAARRWAFSDGATSTLAAPRRTFTREGTVTGTVTVTDDHGATATDAVSVTCSSRGRRITCR